jgi:hypothetical protein
MDQNEYNDKFVEKVMQGLNLAVKKLYEEAAKNNQPLVISINGKIEYIYPKKTA